MKKTIILLLSAAFLLDGAYAQVKSSVTGEYKGKGKVVPNTGDVIEGTVEYYYQGYKLNVWVGDKIWAKRLGPNDIKYFTIETDTFVPVKTPDSPTKEFMLKLTPEWYKIQLFQSYEYNDETKKLEETWYVLLPGEKNSHNVMTDMALKPLNKKVAEHIKDCTSLSDSVLNKIDPYKVSMISNAKTYADIYLKIANAYQQCK
jgi:hypothetical protein